jgi:hypothetical protein
LRSRDRLIASWALGTAPVDAIAQEVITTARSSILVGDNGALFLAAGILHSTPIPRPIETSEAAYLVQALDSVEHGETIEVSADDGPMAMPRARVSGDSDLRLQWSRPWEAPYGVPDEELFTRWKRRRPEAVEWLRRRVRERLRLPLDRPLQAWVEKPPGQPLHVADATAADLVPILVNPTRTGGCSLETTRFPISAMPTLRRSGPGSGYDETVAPAAGPGVAVPLLLDLYPGPSSPVPVRSWPITGDALDRDVVNEAVAAARELLGVAPDAPLRGDVDVVSGPDRELLAGYGEAATCGMSMAAGLGVLSAGACAVVAGLLVGAGSGVLAGVVTAGASLVAAVGLGAVAGWLAPALGERLYERTLTQPVPRAARRLRVTVPMLYALTVLVPVAGAIVTAIVVSSRLS